MGVLDAWKNAEKVTYPVVGEATKDADNVIDYNINEERTTDMTAIFNANNQTTTGNATMIPGVNEPKLIQDTSIYQNSESIVGGASLSGSMTLTYPGSNVGAIRNWTISDTYGNITLENKDTDTQWGGFEIPVSGWYLMDFTWDSGSSTFKTAVDINIAKGGHGNDVTIFSYPGHYDGNTYTDSLKYHFNAGDVVYALLTLTYTGSSPSFTALIKCDINISKM